MKHADGQTTHIIRQALRHLPVGGRALAASITGVAITVVYLAGIGRAIDHVTAQDVPTLTATPVPLPPDVQEAMANIGKRSAALPASVSSFTDVLAIVQEMQAAEAYSRTGKTSAPLTGSPASGSPPVPRDVAQQAARSLGDVTLLPGPTPCDGEMCYEIEVACPQLAQGQRATLKVGEPTGPVTGTILFWTGWTGTYLWEVRGDGSGRVILDELQAAGFRTVQIRWQSNWWQGAANQLEGHAKLACRPATVARWVYDNFHRSPTTPFCAAGHSNGASEMAYATTQYGLADILDAVLFESGPNWARIDYGCIEDTSDPDKQALFYPEGRDTINWAFGLGATGACVDQDEAFRGRFEEASVAFDLAWQYQYTNTMVAFVFGEDDLSTTAVHGAYYYNTVVQSGSPLVSMDVVTGTGHSVSATPQGVVAIRDTLLNECYLRRPVYRLSMPLVTRQWIPGSANLP